MAAIPTLETARLRLEAPSEAHFHAYRAFYETARGDSHRYGGPRDEKAAWYMMAADLGHWALRGFGMWMIVPRATGLAVGGAGIVHPAGWPRHELTWWLTAGARGTGFATEASRAVIAWARDALGWETVETHTRDDNAPARAIVARLGGRVIARETFPDGIARDVFALPHPDTAKERADG